jgi:fibro-slime domain-containing protein
MQKKFLISAFALAALSSSVFAQDVNVMELDVIIRDFPVGFPGFEEFDADLGDGGKCTENSFSCWESNTQNCRSTSGGNRSGRISNWTRENAICFTGDRYHPCSEGGTTLRYGQNDYGLTASTGAIRGYCNGPDIETRFGGNNCSNFADFDDSVKANWPVTRNGNNVTRGRGWSNPVGVTRGMVQERLDYSQCSEEEKQGETDTERAINGRYCARPAPANGQCYGTELDKWFTTGGSAKTIVDIMTLKRITGTKFFGIQYDYNSKTNWNGFGDDMGYFPLDKYSDDETYGKQSLNVWCQERLDSDDANKPECDKWKAQGGPRNGDAARKTVESGGVEKRKWHNYGFTMAGSGEFKYEQGAGDEFKFIGDDDMWIFLDGELAVDLGGVHLSAPGKIKIDDWARQKGWENGTMHAINFYYADRQTEGSNMMLQMALTDLKPPRFGAPRILKADTEVKDGKGTTIITVNSELNLDQIRRFINEWSDQFPIIVHRDGDPENGKKDVTGYKLESIETAICEKASDGFCYEIVGAVCVDGRNCNNPEPLNSGNYISFNVFWTDLEGLGFGNPNVGFPPQEDYYIRNKRDILATTPAWAPNKSRLPDIDPKPDIKDKNPVKPDFCKESCYTTGGGGKPDPTVPGGSGGLIPGANVGPMGNPPNITLVWNGKDMVPATSIPGAENNNGGINSFGEIGKPIPAQRAGELILTAYPSNKNQAEYSDWQNIDKNPNYKYFGLPPQSAKDAGKNADGWWGEADPTEKAIGGGFPFVKNGFPNESSVKGSIKVAPTRCTAKIDPGDPNDKPKINCLNFNMLAKQPFQLVVTVYDQMGNFVTQYRETVTAQEYRNVVQGVNYNYNPPGDNIGVGTDCETPNANNYGKPTTLTVNGYVNVNVNIYPFSANGRRFGNGVYIAKIDRVDMPYDGCYSSAGLSGHFYEPFVRYHYQQPFGWVRSVE